MLHSVRRFRTILVAGTMLSVMAPAAYAVPPSEPPVSFGPQPLQSTVYGDNYNLVPVSISFTILAAGDYNYSLGTSGFTKLFGAAGSLALNILNYEGVSIADLSISALGNVIGVSSGGTFQAGTYTLQIGAFGVNFQANDVTANFAAVPGPIAGAGLPLLLGFAGYAAWRRRQGAKAVA